MQVAILGPNLMTKGETFHVHSENCADLKKPLYRDHRIMSMDAVSVSEIANEVYCDIIAENPGSEYEYDSDFKVFPCVNFKRPTITPTITKKDDNMSLQSLQRAAARNAEKAEVKSVVKSAAKKSTVKKSNDKENSAMPATITRKTAAKKSPTVKVAKVAKKSAPKQTAANTPDGMRFCENGGHHYKPGRGRPSANCPDHKPVAAVATKRTVNVSKAVSEDAPVKRGPGRPKGSKNGTRTVRNVDATITRNDNSERLLELANRYRELESELATVKAEISEITL